MGYALSYYKRTLAQRVASRNYFERKRQIERYRKEVKMKTPNALKAGMIVEMSGRNPNSREYPETTYAIVLENRNGVLKMYRTNFAVGIKIETYGDSFARKKQYDYLSIVKVLPLKSIVTGLRAFTRLESGKELHIPIDGIYWQDTTYTTITYEGKSYNISNESAKSFMDLLKEMSN